MSPQIHVQLHTPTCVVNRYCQASSVNSIIQDIHNSGVVPAHVELEWFVKGTALVVGPVGLARLCGGKGGFGSLLKGQKGGKKTTNTDAMRDLQGRRIRHAKTAERMDEWNQKKKEEDELVRFLSGGAEEAPKSSDSTGHKEITLDKGFIQQINEAMENKGGAVMEGLMSLKRKGATPAEETKRKRTSSGVDEKSGGIKDEKTVSGRGSSSSSGVGSVQKGGLVKSKPVAQSLDANLAGLLGLSEGSESESEESEGSAQ